MFTLRTSRRTILAIVAASTLALPVAGTLAAPGAAAKQTPDFSGSWQISLTSRPVSGGPSIPAFGSALVPPVQVSAPQLTPTGARPATGTVLFQSVIAADGNLVDIEAIRAAVWSGFLPDLLKTVMESQRRQSLKPARLNGAPVAVILNSTASTNIKPADAPAEGNWLAHDIRIEQTATSLTSRRSTPLGVEICVYPLDGTAATTRLIRASPTAAAWEHTSRWDGDRLVTTTAPADEAGDRRTETRSLSGTTMVVETVWTVRDGVAPIVKRLVYSRVGG